MANTVIKLKRSGTSSSSPSSLEFGELALNYADGELYYKAANGSILKIVSGADNFGTINANGTLILADSPSDILDLVAGDNINITGDAVNDRITISSNALSNSTGTFEGTLTIKEDLIVNGNNTNINGVITIKNDFEINSNKNVASGNAQTVISTFSTQQYRGGKFVIFGKNGNETHITEVLLTHNTSDVFFTEYSVLYSNVPLFSVSADIVSSNVRIILTPSFSGDFSFDVIENKFVIDYSMYNRSQELVYDRAESLILSRVS